MKGKRDGIRCGLMVNGVRMLVFNQCKEHLCKWWGECNYQLGNKLSSKWEEVTPTEEELSLGLGHLSEDIKIWKRK